MARFDLFSSLTLATLLALLALAVWFDLRTRRIPNRLVLVGLAASLVLQAVHGVEGVQAWALGLLAGFGLLVPLYVVRAMGAGDVKLMAMIGSFLGPLAALNVVIFTLVAGGLLAIGVALCKGALVNTLRNVQFVMFETILRSAGGGRARVAPVAVSAGNLPYAVAIAVGTLGYLVLSPHGYTFFA